ncbi:MAG: hypothetical protein IPJ37_22250 [Bacteroidales bacterium]|nr:hypothetical protein [Bacteroidales bacterium]
MDNPEYGYVWFPDAGSNFVPYSTGGNWIMTDYGWTWVSAYEWGWAPFHYGRWDYDKYYGWFWVPDYQWGPAWVNWRSADGYYGWSPMAPGIDINISFGMGYDNNHDNWIFVRDRNIGRSNLNRYYVDRNERDRIIISSRVVNNTYVDNRSHTTYVSGPARDDVQRATGRKISQVKIQETNSPGREMHNGNLNVYRPQVTRRSNADADYAPSRVINRKEAEQQVNSNGMNRQKNENQVNTNRNERQTNTINRQGNLPNSDGTARSRQMEEVNKQKSNVNTRKSEAVSPEKTNVNFNNTYRNNNSVKTIDNTRSNQAKKSDNSNLNKNTRSRNSDSKPQRQENVNKSDRRDKAGSDKQSGQTNQREVKSNREQRRSKSENDKK